MLAGSQRELNSIDDQSGEGYVYFAAPAGPTQTCIVKDHVDWLALPEVFVNNCRRSHGTWYVEDDA
jgi:hypothetical protein